MGGMPTTTILNYYNKGFGDLKKATYQNLVKDLSDNPASMVHLNKYKKKTSTQIILSVVGGALIIGGFATLINATSGTDPNAPEPSVTGSLVTIGVGAGCFWAAFFVGLSKPANLRDAITIYNQ